MAVADLGGVVDKEVGEAVGEVPGGEARGEGEGAGGLGTRSILGVCETAWNVKAARREAAAAQRGGSGGVCRLPPLLLLLCTRIEGYVLPNSLPLTSNGCFRA